MKFKADIIDSPDDNGYYAEIWEASTGKVKHATGIFKEYKDLKRYITKTYGRMLCIKTN